eukprot:gnl/TRDRNA2_/TRDRNA2_177604_c2_seq67.p1 gnl/TRDRNA2_/TRDRNA2_177604_c2~~gnl/TRDRNA2_/TRDRNA2_177604_c2_seq67.p1  ORF type:complete len:726 (+),score=258.22 gnl/TRDRNA2_/TRDRNA2_177604_c2_seq67:62-2179(+)
MKCTVPLVTLLFASMPMHAIAQGPVAKVVALLTELKAKAETNGKSQQQSYDKFACWCERTLTEKATEISDAKTALEEMQKLIMELKGELGTHKAEIAQLTKDIATNKQDQKDAVELRGKQNKEYDTERSDSEACIGALEMAIKALTGAGEGKAFLATYHEAQLLSVVAGVKSVLKRASAQDMISDDELSIVKKFVDAPEEFVGRHADGMSAAQISANPFGDYAPASGQIQGILKGMYDAMTTDLEKDNVNEADKQKAYEEIMSTKKQELETLEKTLQKQTSDEADKSKQLADSQATLDDTKEQLKADEAFFADTKQGCKDKAAEWAERTRLRTEELQGINKAIQILDSPEARKTFTKSTTTFLQLKSVRKTVKKSKMSSARTNAYSKLKAVATKYQNVALAEAAASVKTGGHFDEAIASVVEQVKLLREEEQADIDHRDRCQSAETKNKQDMADLDHEIEKTKEALGAMDDTSKELQKRIETLESQMKETKTEMKEILDSRNEEVDAFRKAMQEDMDAVDLLDKAIVSLSAFYKRNKLPLSLAQKANGPKYSVDEDKAPETTFAGADYGGRQSESSGLIGMLSMLKEDTEKEIQTSKEDDAEAEAEYEKERGALQATYDATKATKIETETQLADLKDKIAQYEEYKMQKGNELDAQKQLEKTIFEDCEWVKTEFEDRAKMRKQEMQDLLDSKNMLGGMEGDDDDQ